MDPKAIQIPGYIHFAAVPILNILVLFYTLLHSVSVPGALGFAIILLSVAIRLLINPMYKRQMHLSKKMAELKPHMDKLQDQHKKDPKRLQQEQLKLYKEHGFNPFTAGCLPFLVQIPIFFGLFSALSTFLSNGAGQKSIEYVNSLLYSRALVIDHVINPNFLGLNLTLSPQAGGNWAYYLIPVITGVLQFYQTKVTMPQTSGQNAQESNKTIVKKDKNKETKPDMGSDFQKAMNTQMKYILPFMIGYFAFTLPVGMSLYWNIFSLFSILQYQKLKS